MIYTIFIIPLLIIVVGYFMFKYPPKKINYFIGYRTYQSMKNEKIWKIANQYCGKLWIKTGIIMLIVAIVLFSLQHFNILNITENILLIIMFCQIGIILLSIFIIERVIRNCKF